VSLRQSHVNCAGTFTSTRPDAENQRLRMLAIVLLPAREPPNGSPWSRERWYDRLEQPAWRLPGIGNRISWAIWLISHICSSQRHQGSASDAARLPARDGLLNGRWSCIVGRAGDNFDQGPVRRWIGMSRRACALQSGRLTSLCVHAGIVTCVSVIDDPELLIGDPQE
jgi:hypothetical protein